METRSKKRARSYLLFFFLFSCHCYCVASATVNTLFRASRSREPKNFPPMDSTNESSGSGRDRRWRNSDWDNLDKGNEKGHDFRVRDRDSERGLALNMENCGVGYEDDSDRGWCWDFASKFDVSEYCSSGTSLETWCWFG